MLRPVSSPAPQPTLPVWSPVAFAFGVAAAVGASDDDLCVRLARLRKTPGPLNSRPCCGTVGKIPSFCRRSPFTEVVLLHSCDDYNAIQSLMSYGVGSCCQQVVLVSF